MSRLVNWIKKNKLFAFLLLLVVFLLFKDGVTNINLSSSPTTLDSTAREQGSLRGISSMPSTEKGTFLAPPSERVDRIVIKDTTLSLVVSNVQSVLDEVEKRAKQLGGFLVNSELNMPEGLATGTITVRVPETKRQEALTEFKKLAVKVVSEHVSGVDVTDEYVDLEARLAVLQKTKAKFEAILEGATKVQDLLEVQRELIAIQERIDNVKGQQKYLEQSAKLSLITVYLSTDELALPYTPDQAWRPNVIFKQAVRSLVETLRGLVNILIWITVFTPLWLPIALVIWHLKKRKKI